MSLARLGATALCTRSALHRPRPLAQWSPIWRMASTESANISPKGEPVKFTASKGYRIMPLAVKGPPGSSTGDPLFWPQPYIVAACTALFCLYFFVLREENDVDLRLSVDVSAPNADQEIDCLEAMGVNVSDLRWEAQRVRDMEKKMLG
eukprot:maker-scaffold98_size375582-snap-gene-2.39 protein:Tk06135 transcript:maker-scaffold98_size375582-snap-gene-2.39-mRNA-1 annotation:"GD10179"